MSADTAFEVGRLYGPIKAIADTLTAAQKDIFIRLPGLAGYYPMSVVSNTGGASEHSQGGTPVVETGTVPLAFDGNSYRHVGNGTNYLSAVGVYGLTGIEAYISSSIRGFTIGGWFMVDTVPAQNGGLITKDAPAPERGYTLVWRNANNVGFFISGNGAATNSVISQVSTIAQWHFIVGRFTPSTEVAVFVDGDKTVDTTAIASQCNVSAQAFEVGRTFNDNNQVAHAKCRDVFICRSALSDELIEEVRQSSVP